MRKTVSSVRQWNWPALLGWLVFALALTGFDQWTKNWIQHRLITGDVDRITDFFNLVVAYNSGAAFSFLADAGGWQRPLFAGLAIIVSLVIGYVKEETCDVENTDKRSKNRFRDDRRSASGCDPVDDKYEDRRRGGNSRTDLAAGSSRM